MADLNRPFQLTDWNALIQQANGRRQEAIDGGCRAPDDPLQEVTAPHRWRRQDIISMRAFLKVLCDDSSFTGIPDYWPAQSVREIENYLTNVAPCYCCEPGVEERYTECTYYLTVFPTWSERWTNLFLPLVNETEGNAAAETAYTQWQALEGLLASGASEATVEAQVAALKAAAEESWNYASSAHTGRTYLDPLSQWILPSLLRTAKPVIKSRAHLGGARRYWVWCRTYITVRIVDYYCYLDGTFLTIYNNYRFKSSPGQLPILKNIFVHEPQSMFCRSYELACDLETGHCDTARDCIAGLASTNRKYNVTVTYHTNRHEYAQFIL